jgi:hypothetical protein
MTRRLSICLVIAACIGCSDDSQDGAGADLSKRDSAADSPGDTGRDSGADGSTGGSAGDASTTDGSTAGSAGTGSAGDASTPDGSTAGSAGTGSAGDASTPDGSTGGSAGTGSSGDASTDATSDAPNDAASDGASDAGPRANDSVWVLGSGGVVLHWNGTSFRTVPTGTSALLADLWGSSAHDVWAVGSGGTILHWDGFAWSPVPSGVQSLLLRVWGTGPTDVWALSNTALLHWDGTSWSTRPFPEPPFLAFPYRAATGPNDVWACGNNLFNGGVLVARYDGATWSEAIDGEETPMICEGMLAIAPNNVWVTVQYNPIESPSYEGVIHWNGSRWTGDGIFSDIWGIFASHSGGPWVVDSIGQGSVVYRWDGTKLVKAGDFPDVQVQAVGGPSSGNVWAVGGPSSGADAGSEGTIFHRRGATWTRIPSGTSATLYRVWTLPTARPPATPNP